MWVVAKYIKYIVIFALLWGFLVFYSKFGCVKSWYNSMAPTVKQDDIKTIYAGQRRPKTESQDGEIEDGDIVVFQFLTSAKQESTYYYGRVVGHEGERIEVVNGRIKRNGTDLNESYVQNDAFIGTEQIPEILVPRGCYFILGDNRKESRLNDSRSLGPIPMEAVVGKVKLSWP